MDKNTKNLALLAKFYALERRKLGDLALETLKIEEADLFEAMRAYRLVGDPDIVREFLGAHTIGDAPLSAQELKHRLDEAKKEDKVPFSDEVKGWLERIGTAALSLERAVPPGTAANLPPFLQRIADYEDTLKKAVRGQDEAMTAIACALAGAKPQKGRPAGVYVLAGAPAAGKSLAAQTLATALTCDYFSFDCSRIDDSIHESLARGDEPSIAKGREGELTAHVRKHPDCVVELRNFERMSPDAHGFLLEILDKGSLKDLHNDSWDAVDFTRVHLALEVHGCEELCDSPELRARLREDGGEGGLRNALLGALRKMKSSIRNRETRTFSAPLLAKLENMACFCLFNPLDSASLLGIVREALPKALKEAAGRLDLEADRVTEPDLTAAAKMLLWEKGGRAAAGAFAPPVLAGTFFGPLFAFLRETGDRAGSAPAKLRLAVGKAALTALKEKEDELGADPVQTLCRRLKRLRWEANVALKGGMLTFSLEKPELVMAPDVDDFGDGPDKLMVTVPSVRFEDVKGLGKVKEQLTRQITQVMDWRRLRAQGHTVPGGILLYGLPGTGKTLLARACAGQFDLPFLDTTGSRLLDLDLQRRIFGRLKKRAPAVLFVDEIDAVCSLSPALLELQGHMDGFASADAAPVFVIAATNYLERLPPALMREGRLGEKPVEVPLPDREARKEMFKPVAERLEDGALDLILDFTEGLNGAAVRAAVKDLVLLAPDKNKLDLAPARDALFEKLYGDRRYPSPEDRLMVAYHEAGHAALLLDELETESKISYMTLTLRERDTAHVRSAPVKNAFTVRDKEHILHRMAVSLAGMTAQSLFAELKDRKADETDLQTLAADMRRMVDLGDSDDLRKANELAYLALSAGLDHEIGLLYTPSSGEGVAAPFGATREEINRRMRAWLNDAEKLARRKLAERWNIVSKLAEELDAKGALGRREIDEIVRGVVEAVPGGNPR